MFVRFRTIQPYNKMGAVYPWKSFKNLENLVKLMVLLGFLQNRSGKSGKTNGCLTFVCEKLLKSGTGNGFGTTWVQNVAKCLHRQCF
jgi:hypothetical protein